MGEPLTHSDPAAATGEGPLNDGGPREGLLADSTRRLERALAALEASLKRAVAEAMAPSGAVAALDPALLDELEGLRAREREFEAAATAASEALGRAAAEVQDLLAADAAAASQGELDFALESPGALADDEPDEAAEPPKEDPT